LLNVALANPTLDHFWLYITQLHKQSFMVFVAFPALFMALLYIYSWRIIKPLAALTVTIGLSDAIAYRLIKNMVLRPRPFNNPEVAGWLRKVGEAHGPSFPSNHAANCFAGAAVLSWYFPRGSYFFYSLAALVAYSRVALGVHYPGDVLAGTVLGIVVGFVIRIYLLERVSWFRFHPVVSKVETYSGDWRTRTRRLEQD